MKATHDKMRTALVDALNDLDILSGNVVGPSNTTWQDVAGTCAVNFRYLANQLDAARSGNAESFLVFPCPRECCPK